MSWKKIPSTRLTALVRIDPLNQEAIGPAKRSNCTATMNKSCPIGIAVHGLFIVGKRFPEFPKAPGHLDEATTWEINYEEQDSNARPAIYDAVHANGPGARW